MGGGPHKAWKFYKKIAIYKKNVEEWNDGLEQKDKFCP